MDYAESLIQGYHAVTETMTVLLSHVLGEHWVLFVAFLLLNVVDWLTGWMKNKLAGSENSVAGRKGVLKKLGYWLMIMVAFGISTVFIEIGNAMGMDLGITVHLGWFVLASLLISEIRAILKNFAEAGYRVPEILVNGLKLADEVVHQEKREEKEGENKDD